MPVAQQMASHGSGERAGAIGSLMVGRGISGLVTEGMGKVVDGTTVSACGSASSS